MNFKFLYVPVIPVNAKLRLPKFKPYRTDSYKCFKRKRSLYRYFLMINQVKYK